MENFESGIRLKKRNYKKHFWAGGVAQEVESLPSKKLFG
jgi:hypothetical protein